MIFTADKERDIIDKLTEENRSLKGQIESLQFELKSKDEIYSESKIILKDELKYQTKEKEKYFREIENITNLYNKQIKELKEENEIQKELIETPKNAEIILAELTNMIYTIEETTMKINKLLERESQK